MTGASSVFISIPGEKAAPNGMTFDKKGNIYLTDSLQGTVWKTDPNWGRSHALGQDRFADIPRPYYPSGRERTGVRSYRDRPVRGEHG